MKISALIENSPGNHRAVVRTGETEQIVPIPAKATGGGSALNGGELLCLALATCYCNDIYREAGLKHIEIFSVQVEAHAEFGKPGAAGMNFHYHVRITGDAPDEVLHGLATHTDTVSEIQKTLRNGAEIQFHFG